MYRSRRKNSFSTLLFVVLIGVIGGVAFLVYDSSRTSSVPVAIAPTTPTAAPTITPAVVTPTPPTGGIMSEAQILIPSLGIAAPVIEVFLDGQSWDVSRLGRRVGHLQGTSWLDERGNVVLSGHVEMADGGKGIFAPLGQMAVGEQIIIQYQGTERLYRVSETKVVEPEDLTPLYPTSTDRLTLITCTSYDWIQDVYHERIVVVAERVE